MNQQQVRNNLYWVGALDPTLRVFDVIMHTDYGTSYNAYLLKTSEGNILFETVKAKFFDRYIENLKAHCSLDSITHIVVSHTEPDHVGSLERLLEYAPQVKIVASQVALNFLEEICNKPINGIAVDDTTRLTIGNEELQFRSVPFLHWPDTIYTYIPSHKALITCDSFGCHYADERLFNDRIEGDFTDAYKYYFDMIMGPFKTHVQYALKQIEPLDIEIIAPGHGPVLRENLSYYLDLYDTWSKEEHTTPTKPSIVNTYVSAYGYTQELAQEINAGIAEEVDATIELFDMVEASHDEVLSKLQKAQGILFGTPTVNGDALPPVASLVGALNGITDGGKVAAAYGSYGWSGEGALMLNARLNLLRMDTIEPPLRVPFKPSSANREEARAFGRRFGKKVKESWEQLGASNGAQTYWKCTVCGEVFQGALPPMSCPVCGVGSEAFIEEFPDIVTYHSHQELRAVIIGSGAAAVSAAEAIRARNSKATIDIYTAEEILPYYRPVLTEMIHRKDIPDHFEIHPPQFYDEHNISIHLKSPVASLDTTQKELTLASGTTVAYDTLLIATGATPFVPPITGAHLPQVITIRTKKDVDKVTAMLTDTPTAKVTVIGGGLLGLEAACSIAGTNHEVVVVDSAPTILPRQTDTQGSALLATLAQKSPITLVTNTSVKEIVGTNDTVTDVVLQDGQRFATDIVVISAGVVPTIDIAQEAGITCDRAIVVDDTLATSAPDVYSAGDCAVVNATYYGVWEPALAQGRVAGANMTGDKQHFKGQLYPATLTAFNTTLFSMGDLCQNDDPHSYQVIRAKNEIAETYTALYFKKSAIVGALLIGNSTLTALLISALREKFSIEKCYESKII